MANKINPLLAQFEVKIRNEERTARDVLGEIDMMTALIVMADNFKVGPGRAPKMIKQYTDIKTSIAQSIVDDGRYDDTLEYSKAKLAERMMKICGEHWPEVQHWFCLLSDYWVKEEKK